jgi:hypothetical protein
MTIRFVLIWLLSLHTILWTPNHHFHILDFTTSDPIIAKRCVIYDTIIKLNKGYVNETYDNLGRCTSLEFYEKPNIYYETADFPSKVKYVWTDSSFIQTLYHSDGQLFSKDYLIRPNKVEYILINSKVIRIKDYFNDKLIDIENCNHPRIEEADLFMMYSGCEIKYNSNYRVKF